MSEISKYDAYKKKLEGICDENHLCYRFRESVYPITLTITPVSGAYEQLSMLEAAEEKGYISPDAALVFYMADGELGYKTSQVFTISDALFNKLKNLFKKLHYYWLQYFFRNIIERGVLRSGTMPVIDEDNVDDEECEKVLEEECDDEWLEDTADEEAAPEDNIMSLDDFLVEQAIALVRAENKATVSLLQRRLNVGYSKASSIRDELINRGIIGATGPHGEYEVLPCDIPDDEEEIK